MRVESAAQANSIDCKRVKTIAEAEPLALVVGVEMEGVRTTEIGSGLVMRELRLALEPAAAVAVLDAGAGGGAAARCFACR